MLLFQNQFYHWKIHLITKLNNKESLISRIKACESLIEDINYNTDIIQKISEKYKNRLNEIS